MRNERASQEVHDPPDQYLALGVVKTRDLARRLRDVLDMRVQLSVLPPEWLCRAHLLPRFPISEVSPNDKTEAAIARGLT
jgi:hypothetical protein